MAVKNMIRTTTTTKYWGSRIKKQFSNRKRRVEKDKLERGRER